MAAVWRRLLVVVAREREEIMKLRVLFGTIGVLTTLCMTPCSLADTFKSFTFNVSGCSGGCATPAGTVNLNETASGVNVIVALTPNQDFSIETGGHFSFTFNLDKSSITAVPISDFLVDALGNSTALGTTDFAFVNTTSGSFTNSPFTGFDYAIQCALCAPNLKGVQANSFSFTLAGVNIADFVAADPYNGNTIHFSADVRDLATGNTGAVGAQVPEPSSAMLLGTGLSGLGLWLRRRSIRAKP